MIDNCHPSLFSWGDASINWIAAHLRQTWLTPLMLAITNLGEIKAIIMIGSLCYWLWNKRYSKYLAYGIFATIFLNLWIKNWVMECRPATEMWLQTVKGYSFPSGHAQAGILLWWGLAYYVHSKSLSRLYLLIGLLIVFSRSYLGVHYPFDIISGGLLGLGTLAICVLAEKKNLDPLGRFALPIQCIVLVIALGLIQSFLIDRSDPGIAGIGMCFGFWLGCQLEHKQLHFVPADRFLTRLGQLIVGGIGLWFFVFQLDHWRHLLQPEIALPLHYLQYAMIGFWVAYAAPFIAVKLGIVKNY